MKNFNKLSVSIIILGGLMIALSFIPELKIWKEFFQFEMKQGWTCHHGAGNYVTYHHWHWNYRGWIWFITGLSLFIVQVIRIVFIFKDKDFNQ